MKRKVMILIILFTTTCLFSQNVMTLRQCIGRAITGNLLLQKEILLSQLILPTVFINAGLLMFYSLVAAFGMIKLPPKYLVSFVFIMILTRNAMAPNIGSSIYSNWTYHRQQFYIENFIQKIDMEQWEHPAETIHKLVFQSNLASWKEITGYTIWMIIGMSVITLILPYHKKETS